MAINKKRIIGLIIGAVLLFFFLEVGFFDFLYHIFNPGLIKVNKIADNLDQLNRKYLSKDELLNEIDKLQTEIYSLHQENVNLRLTAQDINLVKQYLGSTFNKKYPSALARIIGQHQEIGFNYFIIDKGQNDGIKIGQPLVNQQGYLLGKIMKVDNHQAYFVSLYDNYFSTSIDFLGDLGQDNRAVSGVAQGKHGLGIEIKFVPLDFTINQGDYIITSGLEDNIPRGLILGTVKSVQQKSGVSFQDILVEPVVNLRDLRVVSVLLTD